MRFANLASSSAGNCYYVEMERKEGIPPLRLLLEVGLSYSEILEKLSRGVNPAVEIGTLDGVLVTHDHKDHAKAVKDFARRGFRVWGNRTVASGEDTLLSPGVLEVIGEDAYCLPFEVDHDAETPLGYIVKTSVESLLFVADCHHFDAAALSEIALDYVVIEANHDGQIMHIAMDETSDVGKKRQFERILHAHMSIARCIKHLKLLNLSQCKAIFLIHLSDRHSRALEFKYKVAEATGKRAFICQKNGGVI